MELEKFEKSEYFVNRELSWLKFDERVLSEARDKTEIFKYYSFQSGRVFYGSCSISEGSGACGLS